MALDNLNATKQSVLDINEAQQSPLSCSTKIDRQLSLDGILLVMEDLQKIGHAEPADKSRSRWYIYWESLEESASNAIYRWALSNRFLGMVCSFYELTQGDNAVNEVFYGLYQGILLKA